MTTELVIEWIRRLGGRCIRLNAEDLEYPNQLSLRMGGEQTQPIVEYFDCHAKLTRSLPLREINVVWYRRWTSLRQHHMQYAEFYAREAAMQDEVVRYLDREIEALGLGVLDSLRHAHWLSDPQGARLDKLPALMRARALGLEIPATLVTSCRSELQAFAERHGRIITKNLGRSPLTLRMATGDLATYTSELTLADIAALPPRFLPSLVQERIDKRFELRIFALGEQLRAMAIFSQANPESALDCRRNQDGVRARHVPYVVPEPVAEQLRALLRDLDLQTASIDMIRASDGRYVFLEVNPVGQFGMVSHACNYGLERRLAEYLIEHDVAREASDEHGW